MADRNRAGQQADQAVGSRESAAAATELSETRKGLDLAPVAFEPLVSSTDSAGSAAQAAQSTQAVGNQNDAPVNLAPVDYDG
jgi:hypothetical protein